MGVGADQVQHWLLLARHGGVKQQEHWGGSH